MKFIKPRHIFLGESKIQMDIPKSVMEIYRVFQENGHSLYLVGGSVRDFLTGEKPKDFDLASDASYEEMDRFLKDKYNINHQGKSHGIIALFHPDEEEPIEIATFQHREGGETKFGVSIDKDVQRRDLTFNALFYDIGKKEIVDLVGGIKDLEDKRVRMVGNADDRIDEDPLRILRVFRFATRYNFEITPDLKEAIHRNKHKLRQPTDERPDGISNERIWDEFTKAFSKAKDFKQYLDYISEFELWNEMFPGIEMPGSSVEHYRDTNSLSVSVAQILRDETAGRDLMNKMDKWKMTSPKEIRREVNFLLTLFKLSYKNAYDMYLLKLRNHVSNELIEEWFRVNYGEDSESSFLRKAFLKFEPQLDTDQIKKDLGIELDNNGNPKNPRDGKLIGQEKIKRANQQFQELLK